MNIEELIASAKALLEEADAAIEAGDLELAGTKQAEAAEVGNTIKAVKAQNDMKKNLDTFVPEKDEEPESKAVRMPFDVDDGDDNDEKEDVSLTEKSVYKMRYGDMDTAQEAVIADLYGKGYMQRRANQWAAFTKYIRTGRLNAREEESLKSIVLLPDAVAAQIKGGYSVAEVKATLQEGINDLGGYPVEGQLQALAI